MLYKNKRSEVIFHGNAQSASFPFLFFLSDMLPQGPSPHSARDCHALPTDLLVSFCPYSVNSSLLPLMWFLAEDRAALVEWFIWTDGWEPKITSLALQQYIKYTKPFSLSASGLNHCPDLVVCPPPALPILNQLPPTLISFFWASQGRLYA